MRNISLAAAIAMAAFVNNSAGDAGSHEAAVPPDLSDPVSLRINMMKQNGAAMGLAAAMVKGEAPFDARVAQAAFRTMHAVSLGFGSQFGGGKDTEYNTRASDKIWDDADGFRAANDSFLAETAAAIEANPQDIDSFKASFGKVAGNCQSCHETYRLPKN